ncbi:MAG: hypothetical protein IJ371_05030 [Clostridia bacterium]|nr:hypothetical protein [Clostridia bacterium]
MAEIKETSRFVHLYKDEDGISVLAQAIDNDTKYTIEFPNRQALEFIFNSYPLREFEGFFANFNERHDKATGKAYVDVTFRPISKAERVLLGKNAIPGFKLNLTEQDVDLAKNVFSQLTIQALQMEQNKKKGLFTK